jgi:hypothetical protein
VNRADRRAADRGRTPLGLSATPAPGARPVTVTREIPVTVLASGDGSRQVVNHDTDEPCFGCPCCALWARSLDALAAAIREHEDGGHSQLPDGRHDRVCPLVWWDNDNARCTCVEYLPGCLVCQMLAGAVDHPPTPDNEG